MWSVVILGPKIFGLWWSVVVCGGLRWSVVVCGVQADRPCHFVTVFNETGNTYVEGSVNKCFNFLRFCPKIALITSTCLGVYIIFQCHG